jgi:hypothetical protein
VTVPGIIEESGGGLVFNTDEELATALDDLVTKPLYRCELGLRGYHACQQKWTADIHLQRDLALIKNIGAKRGQRLERALRPV